MIFCPYSLSSNFTRDLVKCVFIFSKGSNEHYRKLFSVRAFKRVTYCMWLSSSISGSSASFNMPKWPSNLYSLFHVSLSVFVTSKSDHHIHANRKREKKLTNHGTKFCRGLITDSSFLLWLTHRQVGKRIAIPRSFVNPIKVNHNFSSHLISLFKRFFNLQRKIWQFISKL